MGATLFSTILWPIKIYVNYLQPKHIFLILRIQVVDRTVYAYLNSYYLVLPSNWFFLKQYLKLIRGIQTTKISWIIKYFLNEISALSLSMFTFCWENKFLIGQYQQKISQSKLILRSWKKGEQNLVKKTFGDPQNFGGSDAKNELLVSSILIQPNKKIFNWSVCKTSTLFCHSCIKF